MKLKEFVKKMKEEGNDWNEIEKSIIQKTGHDKRILTLARREYLYGGGILWRNFLVKFPDGFQVKVFSINKVDALEKAKEARERWAVKEGR